MRVGQTLESQLAQERIEVDHLKTLLQRAHEKTDDDKESLKKATRFVCSRRFQTIHESAKNNNSVEYSGPVFIPCGIPWGINRDRCSVGSPTELIGRVFVRHLKSARCSNRK